MLAKMDNLRPSGFSRIIECPGSRRMQSKVPGGGVSSTYARQGSAAHTLVSDCLTSGTLPLEHWGRKITQEGEVFTVDSDMVQATQVMVGYCRARMKGSEWVAIEKRLSIPGLDMPKGGTGDFISVVGDTLYVVDYKHGAGVYVEVVGNAQFLCYGHGAACTMPQYMVPDIEKITLVCIQPRIKRAAPIRTWDLTPRDMGSWLNNIAYPAVKASLNNNAPLVPGKHCKFCDARSFCTGPMQKTYDTMKGLKG